MPLGILSPGNVATAAEWQDVFAEERNALSVIAQVLVEGPCSPAIVLFQAQVALEGRSVPVEFRYGSAIRTVVLEAVGMPRLNESAEGIELCNCEIPALLSFARQMGTLPVKERRALILRDVLGYCRRDTALLLKMSDWEVDEHAYQGRKRLELDEQTITERFRPLFAPTSIFTGGAMQPITNDDAPILMHLKRACS